MQASEISDQGNGKGYKEGTNEQLKNLDKQNIPLTNFFVSSPLGLFFAISTEIRFQSNPDIVGR